MLLSLPFSAAMSEDERMDNYQKRGYQWPLKEVVPNTEGWRNIFNRRSEQIQRMPSSGPSGKYDAWLQTMSSAVVAPNFTENGWGLTRAPTHLVEELQKKIRDNVDTAPMEYKINVIETEMGARPLFIRNDELNAKVMRELQPMHEEWAGVELQGAIAYGLRLYQNNSRLLMHTDKPNTHVISCIFHLDRSDDAEPWPIVIEDFQGNTNEVYLEKGDILFYESSKCLHGRPHKFTGSWYSSIFVHYYPKDEAWKKADQHLEAHYAVPAHWREEKEVDDELEELVMVGTSMKEPGCENRWCGLGNSVKWYGPGIEGKVITTGWSIDDEDDEEL